MPENRRIGLDEETISQLLKRPQSWEYKKEFNEEFAWACLQADFIERMIIRGAIQFEQARSQELKDLQKALLKHEQDLLQHARELSKYPDKMSGSTYQSVQDVKQAMEDALRSQMAALQASIEQGRMQLAIVQQQIVGQRHAVNTSQNKMVSGMQAALNGAIDMIALPGGAQQAQLAGQPITQAQHAALLAMAKPRVVPLADRAAQMGQNDPTLYTVGKSGLLSGLTALKKALVGKDVMLYEIEFYNALGVNAAGERTSLSPSLMRERKKQFGSVWDRMMNGLAAGVTETENNVGQLLEGFAQEVRLQLGLQSLGDQWQVLKSKLEGLHNSAANSIENLETVVFSHRSASDPLAPAAPEAPSEGVSIGLRRN